MKQTAVEWFYQRILSNDIKQVFEQAKAMEKEQIVEAWNDGNFLGRNGNILADYSDGKGYYKSEFENK